MKRTKLEISLSPTDKENLDKLKGYADLELLEDGSIDSILVKQALKKVVKLFEEGKIDSIF